MRNKFCLVKSESAWKNKHSVEELDYSILLSHVFGRPVRAEEAFMYLFRRYGLPGRNYDDYKNLCSYTFYTAEKDIIVRWCMNAGDYHHGLCAFADTGEWEKYGWWPIRDWHNQLQAMAEKDGGVYFGGAGLLSMYRKGEDGKGVFRGNEIQKKHIDGFLSKYSRGESKKAWSDLDNRMWENDKAVREKYNIPFPVIETQSGKPFCCQFDNQVEAGKQQHEWVTSLPGDHFLRRVYFAAMALFENWKRPTYIRDEYFNLTCEESIYCKGRLAKYTNWTLSPGNGGAAHK